MSEDHIIRNCAPTLAGIKTGSIFSCPYENRKALLETIRQLNRRLGAKGLRILPLRFTERTVLIYLYRPRLLNVDLAVPAATALLRRQGYETGSSDKCVACLARKLRTQGEFPHEIGLFLGYPPEDVHGFMEKKGCGCKCVGCWKVYGDEAEARKKFDQYKKCTQVYRDKFAQGRPIERLTVTA